AGVAQDDHPAALHHEAGEGPGPAADEDGAALHVDAGAAAHVPPADQVPAAQGRPEGRAGVLLNDHRAGQHVLGAGPADPPLDVDVGAVDQAAAEVAEAALEDEAQAVEDADAERVLGHRVVSYDGSVALAHQPADPGVD